MLDPGLLVQAKLDADIGIPDSPVWLKYKERPVEVIAPGGFEVTLVCDLSGSMEDPMEKLIEERRCTILFLEALKDFHQLAEKHREEMVELGVKSEVRGFGGPEFGKTGLELKPLSPELSEKMRIKVFKNLARAPGTRTFDHLPLIAIRESIDDEKKKKLASGELKKAIIVFSDGLSHAQQQVKGELKTLRDMGVTVVGVGITRHARAIENTYSPEGKICDEVSQLAETLAELLKEFTKDL
jgi:nitric oxide reductase activation protein